MAWYFLSNHGLVLVYLHRHPTATRPQIAAAVGITERHVSRVLAELTREGVVRRSRREGGFVYEVAEEGLGRHPMLTDLTLRELLDVLRKGD